MTLILQQQRIINSLIQKLSDEDDDLIDSSNDTDLEHTGWLFV
jgi:hypothetical protein